MNPTDAQLIARVVNADDRDAFAQLVHRHQSAVRHFLRHLSGNAALADELAQETFLSAYRSLGVFRHEGAFSTWLLGIARNHWRNAARKQRTVPLEPHHLEAQGAADSAARQRSSSRPRHRVARALGGRAHSAAPDLSARSLPLGNCRAPWLADRHREDPPRARQRQTPSPALPMERKDFPVNDDPQLDARLREHLAAPALPAEAFTHAVLARLPAAPTREELEVFAAQEAQAKTQRGWAVATGALTGAVVFFLSGRDIDWSERMRSATDAAHAAVSHAVLPAATPLAIAAALTLGVLAFVFWSSLRRWALRQWEQFA